MHSNTLLSILSTVGVSTAAVLLRQYQNPAPTSITDNPTGVWDVTGFYAGPNSDDTQTEYQFNITGPYLPNSLCVRDEAPASSPGIQDTTGDCHPSNSTWSLTNNGTGYVLNIVNIHDTVDGSQLMQYYDSGSVFISSDELTGAGAGQALNAPPDFSVPYNETETSFIES